MNSFEFEVLEYFKLQKGFIGLVGIVNPDDYPYITGEYKVELITASGERYFFKDIGEEVFVHKKDFSKTNKRALRTADNIEMYLKDLVNDPVKLVGYKIKK